MHNRSNISCWIMMSLLFGLISCTTIRPLCAQSSDPEIQINESKPQIIVVVGAGGTPEFAESFRQWADQWATAAELADASLTRIGQSEAVIGVESSDREHLQKAISELDQATDNAVWVVLIGHGTYSQDIAKFNLRGPDLTANELAQWLTPITRPLVIVNCASASGPFINLLSAPNRVVVTATRSGTEQNYARFGQYFADAISSIQSDLDHDDEVSVWEAFLKASAEVQTFYDSESRIATEHALLDDNGDAKGTLATMFQGSRAIASAKDKTPLDGKRAARMILIPAEDRLLLTDVESRQRDEIEEQLDALRLQKTTLSADEYDSELESLLIRQALIYQAAEERSANQATDESKTVDKPAQDSEPGTEPTSTPDAEVVDAASKDTP